MAKPTKSRAQPTLQEQQTIRELLAEVEVIEVDTKCLIYDQWWRQPWHRFIDHLADGNTPEAFFDSLTSAQTGKASIVP